MSKTLDRSRPFGTVHPPYEGAHFEQDGYHFDVEGKLVEALLTPEQKTKLAQKAKPPRPPAGTDGNSEPKQPVPPNPPQAGEGNKDDGGDENAVNLEQWLRDEASAPFKEVRQAVKARYNVWKTAKTDIVALLVLEQHLVAAEDIDPELRKLLPKSGAE